MRLAPFPVIAAVLIVPIYGQKTAGEEQHNQKATKTQQKKTPQPSGITDINKPAANAEEQRHTDQPDGYFNALFSPNNLPNVALTLVGIAGTVVALRTLNWLKTQTRAIERQAAVMEGQATVMEGQLDAMRRSGEQTDTLIQHAARQADLMEQQAEDTRKSATEAAAIANGTLTAIEKQARQMERQIQLQEAAMIQWVSVGNWKCSHIQRNGPSPQPTHLRIEFDIVNESHFPLTVYARFHILGKLPGATTVQTTQAGIPLFPRKPYKCDVTLNITPEQSSEYFDSALRISVHGKITHLGVSNKHSPLMSIDGNLVCRRNDASYLEYESISLTPAQGIEAQTEGQNPN